MQASGRTYAAPHPVVVVAAYSASSGATYHWMLRAVTAFFTVCGSRFLLFLVPLKQAKYIIME